MASNLRRQSIRFPVVLDDSSARAKPRRFEIYPFLASLGMHLLLIAVLACIILEPSGRATDDQIFALFDNGGMDRQTLNGLEVSPEVPVPAETKAADSEREQSLQAELNAATDARLSPEQAALAPSVDQNQPQEDLIASSSGIAEKTGVGDAAAQPAGKSGPKLTAGRTGENKSELLKRFGGTKETEAGVKLGLKWLAKQQMKDGGWNFQGPYSDAANFENRVSATSMALLAFLGAGHTHKSGEYQRQIDSALHWLGGRQKSGGAFGTGTPHHHALYTHAQATIVMCEAYAMTEDRMLLPYCKAAVSFAVRAQGPEGGWRYEFKGDSDTSVTGWFVMALVSAKSAGLDVPEKCLKRINGYLDAVSQDYGEIYSYMPGRPAMPSMTAEGLLCRMYLGWPRGHPAIDRGAQRLLQVAPFQVQTQSYYYWYYATQVMHHVGGESWDAWNTRMRETLPAIQVTAGPEVGSWEPGGRMLDQIGGRLYSTCMALYCLEVYYRHMPIYDSPWEVPRAER